MSRIKSFSALLLVLCVFLSVLTSCDKTAAGETTASDISTDATTEPETTARELHEPNVRQLCGYFGNPSSTDEIIFNLMPENYTLPDIIKSVGQYREFVENCVDFKGNGPYNMNGVYSYGFPLTSVEITYDDGRVKTRYEISKDDFIGIYDDEFFSERVLIIRLKKSTAPPRCTSSVIAMRGNNEFMVFSLGFQYSNSPTLMESCAVLKFIELDRDFLTGKKIVYELAPYYQMEWWDIIHNAQPQTQAEGYALLLETYGDVFYYIEPWALKPES